ncbi:hypothetical protein E3U55_15455 [Filobacillus milosensis]|uniref:Lipoprotein n=1 Tax=Filobacillus milosensis TaxID=94137 RepID=A0A4Y8ICS8_9BACI|nr:DUF6612 family protein [Filobacillus milosensis]TFB13798.1 hypothetical protein E3U55_15455 [Filobacillus milosensis]
MKKFIVLLILLPFILLVACKDEEVTQDGEKSTSNQEILTQTIEQSNEVENVMVDYSINQEIDLPEIEKNLTVEQTDSTYIESDPFRFLTEIQTHFGKLTVFNQEGELYIYDSEQETYESINLKQFDNFEEMLKKQRHIPEILNRLTSHVEDMELKEENNQYILTLKGEGEAYQSFVYNQIVTASIEGANLPIEENNIQVNSVSMELVISKDNYEVQEIFTGFEMSRKDDQNTTINQTIKRVYYDYNASTKEIPTAK